MNLRQLLQHYTAELIDIYEEQEVNSIFYLSVQHISKLNRSGVMLNWTTTLDTLHEKSYLNIVSGLKTGKPIQYLLGEAYFYGATFKVNESVLIPRAETEELVDWILTRIKEHYDPSTSLRLIDFGTGSGCIAISLKKHLDHAIVEAVDISVEAISLAKENAIDNAADVAFIQTDMLSYSSTAKYDVIVSNPPYITNTEMRDMHQNVLDHEPHLALFVPDESPLLFYEAIADFALKSLNKDGYLFFEINQYLSKETVDMLSHKSFTNISLRKDMQGNDRMVLARLQLPLA